MSIDSTLLQMHVGNSSHFLQARIRRADFKKLKTAADYEAVVRNSVSGVPEHWIPEVAKQCVDTSPSPQGRRHALSFLALLNYYTYGHAAAISAPHYYS